RNVERNSLKSPPHWAASAGAADRTRAARTNKTRVIGTLTVGCAKRPAYARFASYGGLESAEAQSAQAEACAPSTWARARAAPFAHPTSRPPYYSFTAPVIAET